MRIDFIGGADVQRSLNHSDSRCVNLVPTLNDKGDIAAYYSAAGLQLEATNPNGDTGSGIYTASNGRCFEVAGTTLYELTDVGGVITTTSRGTVTAAPISRMIDNGIELLIVNGIDGWLFTFSDNTLRKIFVAQEDFTVTIASPAVFTKTAHGLILGTGLRFTSTTDTILSDSLLTPVSPATVATKPVSKYVVATSDNQFVYATSQVLATQPAPAPVLMGETMNMYLRNADTGELTPLSPPTLTQPATNQSGMTITSDGVNIYVIGSYYVPSTRAWTDGVLLYNVNLTTGQLTPNDSTTVFLASATPTSIKINPDVANIDKFAYITNSTAGTISQYSRSLVTGQLSALTPATITCGASPQDIEISTDGLFTYTTNKTANTITVQARTPATGLITQTPVQTISCGGLSPMGLALSPDTDNPHLYVVNNGSNNIAMFSRNKTDGKLTALSTATVSAGTSPQKISCTAESVYVTNNSSNDVSQYSRSAATGLLTALSSPTVAAGTAPVGIVTGQNGKAVYVSNSGSSTLSMYSRTATSAAVGLPTGLSENTTYYVVSEGLTTNTFEVSETFGNDNHFVNPNAPATQTSPSLPIGKYTLSITGTGSIAVAATTATITGAGSAIAGTAVNFEVTKAGTVTYTVTGTPTTARAGVTYVSTSGQQAGIHTYTTLGYGFPEGCKTISYMNGRFAALEPNSQNFFVSEVLNGSWWDALNVQTVDANPDQNVGSITAHQEFIVLGKNSGQVYYDSGAYPTPWVPNPSGIFEIGCSAPYSIAGIDNTVFWLGGNQTGDGMVWKLQGLTPIRISTYSIEFAIQSMSDISDAIAFTYQQDGHNFYVLSFPTGDKTYVYDINTSLWHERANFANGEFSRWAAQEHAYFAGKHLVLGYLDGKIYSVSNSVYTYGTEPRKWLRSFRAPTNSMLRIPHTKLQLDCEVGVGLVDGLDRQVMMRFSDDGGHTWSKELWRSIGKIGEYAKRVIWYQLGITKGQPRIYELSGSDASRIALLNVYLD